ncbi:MAG: hypothetical protein AAF645_28015, partial [Myxococcota bacterium]
RCEAGAAFGPFATVVERALGFLGEMGVSPGLSSRHLSCSHGCHDLWHQHPQSSDLDEPGDSRKARERRLRFFDGMRGLLADVARFRPPVVLLHDLERADAGTLQLLRFLFEGSGPWSEGVSPERSLKALFVASVRRDPGESLAPSETPDGIATLAPYALKSLYANDAASVIRLAPFDEDGVRALLRSDDVVRLVAERTGGFPEAIELLLAGDPLSPEVHLQRRLASAEAPLRALLEALAVLGQPAELSLIAKIADLDVQVRGTHPFSNSDFVVETRLDGTTRFAFARSRHRELLYDGLSTERRIALHRRCADVFAARPGVAMAAHHALRAGDYERALPLALLEADGLSQRHGFAEAAALLERTIGALEPAQITDELLARLADLHRVVGDYRRAIVHARTLWEHNQTSAAAAHRVGRLLTLFGEHGEAESVLRQAQRLAEEKADTKTLTVVDTLLAELYFVSAAYGKAEELGERALQEALESGERALEIHARNTLGKVALARKDAEAAAGLFRQNFERASDHELGHQRAQAMTNHGVAMLRQQRLDDARENFESATAEAAHANDSRELAIATENLAVLAHLTRDYRSALDFYHQAVAQLKRLGNRPMLTRVGNNLGELYLSLNEVSRARPKSAYANTMGAITRTPGIQPKPSMNRGRS